MKCQPDAQPSGVEWPTGATTGVGKKVLVGSRKPHFMQMDTCSSNSPNFLPDIERFQKLDASNNFDRSVDIVPEHSSFSPAEQVLVAFPYEVWDMDEMTFD